MILKLFSHFFLSRYESNENMTIQVSTKVCSFGKQVVEKVETEYPRFEGGRYLYKIHRSPMCEYMINFIRKLKHLPERYMMNSVLENFTILQVYIIFKTRLSKKFQDHIFSFRNYIQENIITSISFSGYNQQRYQRNSTVHCLCF